MTPRRLVRLFSAAALGAAAAVGGVAVLDRVLPPPLERGAAVSTVVADRYGRPLRAFPVAEGRWRLKADLDALDPAFVDAVVAVEDKRFYDHGGVDFAALGRAAVTSLRAGRIVSGGSTITMQTARLLEPRPRTFGSKAVEILRAWQIERRLSKDEILELYLTLAPYGGNLEGARAASWAYFGREPNRLTPDQIALLVALPQAPEARRPDLRPEAARAARNLILDRLAASGRLASDRAADAADEPAPARRAFPADAWHAADEVRRRSAAAGDVRATIDVALQAEVEAIARAAVEADPTVQASILVIETKSRAVRAAVGSAGRDRPGGWLDLTDRTRSPGSTLKPLIYGLAFDDGLAAPDTRIADAPRRFAEYQPENFDRTFRGDVTVAEALQHSLNVPAVQVLDAVGVRRFEAALSFAGADPHMPGREVDPGLAVALGGVGLTARQLGVLYAALGDDGQAKPLVWLESELNDPVAPHPILSAESAREIRDVLRKAPSPAGRAPAALTDQAPRIAFKTGTSYGFRDAWAVGVDDAHTIVVWIGRADGAPRPGVTGRQAALPVLFDAFDRAAAGDAAASTTEIADARSAPGPLERFAGGDTAPHILFPPDGAEVWAERPGRAFVLAGRGAGRLQWYADGAPVARDAAGGPRWTPETPGFYAITAVDEAGRTATARVRVRMP